MCRYAMIQYKEHYACFHCHKTFKRRLLGDVTDNYKPPEKEAKCPDCGRLMANMGKDFESPKKNALKQWRHIETLYTVGITFHSCGCVGPGYIPKDKDALRKHFQNLLEDFHNNLNFWRKRTEPTNKKETNRDMDKNWAFISRIPNYAKQNRNHISNEEAKKYWLARVQEVEHKLQSLG